MTLLLASGIGFLVAAGIYLMLRARTFDVVIGLTLLSYAVNLFIFVMGRVMVGAAPIVDAKLPATLATMADPLPQALVLTAIVISFGMTALLLAMAVRGRALLASDHVDGAAEPKHD
jgi:multicomponent K+:H+ antiporter subunit C